MKKLITISLIAGLFLPLAASAEWELISDFESEDSLDPWTFTNRLSRNEVAPEEWDSTYRTVPRPFDDLGGRALAVSEGSIRWQIFDVGINLGDLPINNTFTVFYELALTDLTPDVVAGLHTGVPEDWFFFDENAGEAGLWVERYPYAHYSTVHRLGRVGTNAHNGTSFSSNYSDNQEQQVWYRFWMVVNPIDFSWNLYVQGGEIEEITQVTTNYSWRNIVFDPLQTWRLRVQGNAGTASSTGAPTYVDNLFLDRSGQNLTLPPRTSGEVVVTGPGAFSDYVLVNGWVDTGDWMGWVYVHGYPLSYVLGFNTWVYATGIPTAPGAWMYAMRSGSTGAEPGDNAGPGVFSDFEVTDGWVNTGDWMGWVYVDAYPAIYTHSLSSWAYAADGDASNGAWIYVYR